MQYVSCDNNNRLATSNFFTDYIGDTYFNHNNYANNDIPTPTASTTTTLPTSLVTFSTDDFKGSGSCALCHWQLTDFASKNVSIDSHWRSTIMANASKDPYWQAIISSEVIHHPQLEDVASIIFDDGFLDPANYLNEAALDGVPCSSATRFRFPTSVMCF